MNSHFSKEDIRNGQKAHENIHASIPLATKEVQIKNHKQMQLYAHLDTYNQRQVTTNVGKEEKLKSSNTVLGPVKQCNYFGK